MLYSTFLGGFIIHIVTVGPWLLGAFFALSPLFFFYIGHLVAGSILLGLVSLQYILPVREWPAFAAWMKKMNPRAYYKKCTLAPHNLKDIRSEKVLLLKHDSKYRLTPAYRGIF